MLLVVVHRLIIIFLEGKSSIDLAFVKSGDKRVVFRLCSGKA